MPPGVDQPLLNLTVLPEPGALLFSLTDSRRIAQLARVAIDDAMLQAAQTFPAEADQAARHGRLLFEHLLPPRIAQALVASTSTMLCLQLPEALAAIPWEAAYDGSRFLADRFALYRQILGDTAPPPGADSLSDGELRLVVVAGTHVPAGALAQRLAGIAGLQVIAAHSDLAAPDARADLAHAHVVHCIDGVASFGAALLDELNAASARPHLLVLQGGAGASAHAMAARACALGLNLLVHAHDGSPDGFDATLYRGLASGLELATAVHAARQAASTGGGAPPHAALYGDGRRRVRAPRALAEPTENSRRQVTVLCCDIVGSTRLIAQWGAERYSELLADFHDLCTRTAATCGGSLDAPQGDDGLMCYFGFPVAREDAAVQALRAALALVDGMASMPLRARVGVATGEVVVKSGQPVGAAVHLAARLQALADPGGVAASDATRQLVGDRFRFSLLESRPQLKGFDEPGPVHRLIAEARPLGTERFDVAVRLTPFIGRTQEMNALARQWERSLAEGARAVLLSGEAGIGKSRLMREFRHVLAESGHETIECRCTPEHRHSALYPVIDLLRRLFGIREADHPRIRRERIAAGLAHITGEAQAVALVAALLSLASEPQEPSLPQPAERRRQLTLDILVTWVCAQARRRALCVLVEDIHWVDPSTREFLQRLFAEAGDAPLLVLMTCRPEAGERPGPAETIEVRALAPEASRAMVLAACADAPLPPDVVRLLVSKTDGVPLFIEESTRMAVDLGSHAVSLASPLSRFSVPASIHDLLMARLDRLPSAKPVAQLGGTIGREFSLALVEAVLADENAPMVLDNVEGRLRLLVNAGLLIERGSAGQRSYVFKHALVRDAAYQSLWIRDRKTLHRAIAGVLGSSFATLVEAQPELLALHYTEAGMEAEAIEWWERAARHAASRSAHDEAIDHLTRGLALVPHLPHGDARDRSELRLQLLLAGRLIATEGYGADRVEQVYGRALALCDSLQDDAALTKVQLGLEGYHFMRGDFERAHAISRQTAPLVARDGHPMQQLQARWAVANILFHQGEVAQAVSHMDALLADYDAQAMLHSSAVQDPGVMCLCYSAWGLWELGRPDAALERAERVVALAEQRDHRFSMGEAHGFRTTVHYFRGEVDDGLRSARRAIEVCEDGGFMVWLAHARVMHGRLLAEAGDAAAGIEEMRRGYALWTRTGAVVTRAFYLAMQAEGLALDGRPDEGLLLLEDALGLVRRHGERYYQAEIERLCGELILQSAARTGSERRDEARRWFGDALRSAHAQQLRGLALRCATSLAQLERNTHGAADALRILKTEHDTFTEGAQTRDVQRAAALLGRSGGAAPGSR